MSRMLRLLAPVALLATGACFATQQDVRVLQSQMDQMRAANAHADSVRAKQLAQVEGMLGLVRDSLTLVSARVVRMNGDVRGDLYGIGQQLIQIQQLTGQSQNRLQELRAALEARNQQIQQEQQQLAPAAGAPGAVPPVKPGAVAAQPAPAASQAPGPNQLFQMALEQLRRGSPGAAQTALQTLLQQYPTADIAPDAQFYLGEAYRAEGNPAAADTAYSVVLQKYPNSPRAPTALYKRALYMEQQGNLTGARAALNQLIQKYPSSDEAALAQEHLRTIKLARSRAGAGSSRWRGRTPPRCRSSITSRSCGGASSGRWWRSWPPWWSPSCS
jgi:tol-pal system protein YbgF